MPFVCHIYFLCFVLIHSHGINKFPGVDVPEANGQYYIIFERPLL